MAAKSSVARSITITRVLFHSSATSRCITSCCCLLSIVFILTIVHSTFAAQLSQTVTHEHNRPNYNHNHGNYISANQNQSNELSAISVSKQLAATIEVATTSSSQSATTNRQQQVGSLTSIVSSSHDLRHGTVSEADNSDQDDDLAADDVSNATMVIDYDQQGYNLSISESSTSTISPVRVGQKPRAATEAEGAVSRGRDEEIVAPRSALSSGEDASALGPAKTRVFNHRQDESGLEVEASGNQPAPSKLESASAQADGRALGLDQSAGDDYRRSTPTTRTTSDAVESLRSKPDGMRDMRGIRLSDKMQMNTSQIIATIFKKKPYSKYWSVEQKWDDLFKRFEAVQDAMKDLIIKNFLKDAEYYADLTVSPKCADDLKWLHGYAKKSTNFRWLFHMFDSTGKNEPGMLTGNLANLGHPIQCIKVRAPTRPSNDTFEERYFEKQTELLGERFRGKFCVASIRPVLPQKPHLVSRFSDLLNTNLLSNISYMGLPVGQLKKMAGQTRTPSKELHKLFDREHPRTDMIPFESELYQYLIDQRNFMFTLPRFMGVCYPSSCTQDDVRLSLQKTMDDQHQVVDIEFECEQEELSLWDWFNTPRLIAYVFIALIVSISAISSIARYIIVDKLKIDKERLPENSRLANLIGTLNLMSMDKCAGNLFVKTNRASPIVNQEKIENNRSTSIDALKGFLILLLVYSELVYLGCLPVPFMWSKWGDAMFPFYRSWLTQIVLNTQVWSEAFYIISAYLISLKLLENRRPKVGESKPPRTPDFFSFSSKRYVRLVMPMVAFILTNYVWPRLSNGFVLQDQANKLMKPCDNFGWTNMLLFHNRFGLNETCLWPSHVSASFFQLHIISYPILLLMLMSLRTTVESVGVRKLISKSLMFSGLITALVLALIGLVYPAYVASNQELIVPFLIDYIDFDNYQRVIEWMVAPTYNHLTSYMVGVILAYFVVRKRLKKELRRSSGQDWYGSYMHREGSFDSVLSSSTQGLDSRPNSRGVAKPIMNPARISISQNSSDESLKPNLMRWVLGYATSGFFIALILLSVTASWFWNGLGQPMTSNQTFWYICSTKLIFCIAFGYIFYTHFATRRNATNPWMITRFLVPIGRMSLTVFYVSWVVIWFDLLASLYQWHPSHYFVCEKFNEIIFMTLILAMLVYGSFEGIARNVQLAGRRERLNQLVAKGALSHSQGFEGMFIPSASSSEDDAKITGAANYSHQGGQPVSDKTGKSHPQTFTPNAPQTTGHPSGFNPGRKRLSIADQYKLNAELRANYSFASIGLYESAGATSDLDDGSRQPSPIPGQKRT